MLGAAHRVKLRPARETGEIVALDIFQIINSSISRYFFNVNAFDPVSFNCIPHLDDPDRYEFRPYGRSTAWSNRPR